MTFLLVIHVFLALTLIALILLQQGKGADAGASFGSGGSSTVFGARGSASFLSRATAIIATLFFLVSFLLFKNAAEVSKAAKALASPVTQEVPKGDAPSAPKTDSKSPTKDPKDKKPESAPAKAIDQPKGVNKDTNRNLGAPSPPSVP
mgnify:CR=1 FL=1